MLRLRNQNETGVTLIEIVITLAIFAILIGVALITTSGSRPKQNLLSTGNGLMDALRRTQTEASSSREIRGLCFKRQSGKLFMQIYTPTLASTNLPTDVDCINSEAVSYEYQFRGYTTICDDCDSNVGENKSIFFNAYGFPIAINGALANYEICLINPKLPAGTRAREVEVTTGGIIELLAANETGSLNGVVVGAGNCN